MPMIAKPVPYKAVNGDVLDLNSPKGNSGGIFKNPRQKTWAVLIKNASLSGNTSNEWTIQRISNDINEIKRTVNEFLKSPPSENTTTRNAGEYVGMNAVIACEILPIDSMIKF